MPPPYMYRESYEVLFNPNLQGLFSPETTSNLTWAAFSKSPTGVVTAVRDEEPHSANAVLALGQRRRLFGSWPR